MNTGSKKLEGEGFTLRKFKMFDVFHFYSWYKREEVTAFSAGKRINSFSDAFSFVIRRVYNYYFKRKNKYYYWTVDIDKKAEGFIGLNDTKKEGVYTVYYMMNPDFWNKGYATKVLKTAESYLKTQNIKNIYVDVDENNLASVKVIENCGLEFVKKYENAFKYPDKRVSDGLRYRINIGQ